MGTPQPPLAQDTEVFLPVTITKIKPQSLLAVTIFLFRLPPPRVSPRPPPRFTDVSRTSRCGSLGSRLATRTCPPNPRPLGDAGAAGAQPYVPRAYLVLDKTWEEAQSDKQLHCGRRPLPSDRPAEPGTHGDLGRCGGPGHSGLGNGGPPLRRLQEPAAGS